MKSALSLFLDGKWRPPHMLIWARRSKGKTMDADLLKGDLFAWHKPSYYGTFLASTLEEGFHAVEVPAKWLFELFTEAVSNPLIDIEPSGQLRAVQALSRGLQERLREDLIHPDFAAWQNGKLQWKHGLDSPLPYADELIQIIMEQILLEQPHYYKRGQLWLASLQENHNLRQLSRGFWQDEREWLEDIGWEKPASPFPLSFVLSEPETPESRWELKIEMPQSPELIPASAVRKLRQCLQLLPWLDDGTGAVLRALDDETAWRFLTEGAILERIGVSVKLPGWWRSMEADAPVLRIRCAENHAAGKSTGRSTPLDLSFHVAIAGREWTESDFRRITRNGRPLFHTEDGWIAIRPDRFQQLQATISRMKLSGIGLLDVLKQLAVAQHDLINGALNPQENPALNDSIELELDLEASLKASIERLQGGTAISLLEPPKAFSGSLRRYQQTGMSWLIFLRGLGLGACLADDMGLGKTIQFISYLLKKREAGGESDKPSLLICPTSVLGNWQKELGRFAPDLKLFVHYGANREKTAEHFFDKAVQSELVLTTYTLALNDHPLLQAVAWDALCLDEAQNIKNHGTRQAASVRKLHADHRIAMTGTPMENRLSELWSIFDFLNPGYLGSLHDFSNRFALPVEAKGNPQAEERLHRLIRPFVLRRTKTDPDIALDLPEKIESDVFIQLTEEQAELYEATVLDFLPKLEQTAGMERKGHILAALTRLKQLCNHPALLSGEFDAVMRSRKADDVPEAFYERSNKLRRLTEMIAELRLRGEKCLIFTQYVKTGHLIRAALKKILAEDALFLHGNVSQAERERMIRQFQNTEHGPGIFILSLKAGGVGLNLTRANHVFHVDRWWNPAVENQATDRAFRIGQRQNVQVHKMITLGTIEERIRDILNHKRSIGESVLGSGDRWMTELDTDELQQLFRLRAEWI